jgi:hypothetical protein
MAHTSTIISTYLESEIARAAFPGAQYAVGGQGEIIYEAALGHAVIEPERIAATLDTIYDLASLTKPLVTSLLAVILDERGIWALRAPAAEYLSELRQSKRSPGLIALLTHTSGLPNWRPLYLETSDPAGVPDYIAGLIDDLPGAQSLPVVYSDLNYILLGMAIERVTGLRLDRLAQQEIIGPLELKRTMFNPPPELKGEIAATEHGQSFEHANADCDLATREAGDAEKENVDGRESAVPASPRPRVPASAPSLRDRLLSLLAHPNIASKHWIIRQYDHEVQGGSVIKPLIGPLQVGPSDASVIRPKLGSHRGVVIGCGLNPQIEDPYEMALAAIDEAVRNVVAVGADPGKVAILDNFCWPSVDDEKTMGTLVRACEACRDAALAYGIPFISGKDSLHNQFTDSETGRVIRIPSTLLISAIGVIDDVRECVTMDLKRPGNVLYRVEPRSTKLDDLAAAHRAVAAVIRSGRVAACHDVSDGGWLVAAAETCIASGLGLLLEPDGRAFFGEPRGQYLVEFEGEEHDLAAAERAGGGAITFRRLGAVTQSPEIVLHLDQEGVQVSVEELTTAWRGTLDW